MGEKESHGPKTGGISCARSPDNDVVLDGCAAAVFGAAQYPRAQRGGKRCPRGLLLDGGALAQRASRLRSFSPRGPLAGVAAGTAPEKGPSALGSGRSSPHLLRPGGCRALLCRGHETGLQLTPPPSLLPPLHFSSEPPPRKTWRGRPPPAPAARTTKALPWCCTCTTSPGAWCELRPPPLPPPPAPERGGWRCTVALPDGVHSRGGAAACAPAPQGGLHI